MTRLARRAFGLALALFPRWFREEYGDDMVSDFALGLAAARRRQGGLGAGLYAVRALVAVPVSALGVRLTGRAEGAVVLGGSGASGWADDARHALTGLRRSPMWTAAALLILTLGIGGTTAVFSVLNAVLLRPLPFEEPRSLASLWTANKVQGIPDGSSWDNATDWETESRALEEITFVLRPEFTTATVSSFGQPERIHVGLVSSNFFTLLGVEPVAGRTFAEGDLDTDDRVAVIAEELWSARYGSDPGAVGSTLTIDGEEVRIVGVAPARIALPLRETRVWRLVDPRPTGAMMARGSDVWWVLGRLADGVTPEAAQAELTPIADRLAIEYPDTNRDIGVSVTSLRAEIVGDRLPLLLWTLFASMLVVLAIGGTNVAQLMMSRGVARQRELAVRASLGATRARVLRQLALEGAFLGLAAGAGGILLAAVGLRGLLALVPPDVPLTEGVSIDRTVLALAMSISVVVAPVVGLLPGLRTSRMDVASILRSGERGSTGRDQGIRAALVVAEVTMAVVLLSGAGLLVRSALRLQAVDPGFDHRSTLIARVDLPPAEDVDRGAEVTVIEDRLSRIPGVVGVGAIGSFFIFRNPDQTVTLVGDTPRDPAEPAPRLTSEWISAGFFEALGVPLLRGRPLDDADFGVTPQPVVVNQAWVDLFSEGRDPVGLQFRWGRRIEGNALEVVGVVGDVLRTSLEERPYPQIFMPGAWQSFDVMVRADGDPLAVAGPVRDGIREIAPGAAITGLGPVTTRYDLGLSPRRFQTLLFEIFAGLAMLLAAMGLFAVLHEGVSSRRREIGIRLALGAAPSSVRRMVLRRGALLSLTGAAIGILTVAALSSVTSRMVYGIGGADPLTLAAVAGLVLAVTLLASGAPALRATRVAPVETLADA